MQLNICVHQCVNCDHVSGIEFAGVCEVLCRRNQWKLFIYEKILLSHSTLSYSMCTICITHYILWIAVYATVCVYWHCLGWKRKLISTRLLKVTETIYKSTTKRLSHELHFSMLGRMITTPVKIKLTTK